MGISGILMDFKKIGINAVRSNTGFIVKRTNRFELEYIDKNNKISIEVEPGKDLALYVSFLEIDNKERIVKNVCQALDYMKVAYTLD